MPEMALPEGPSTTAILNALIKVGSTKATERERVEESVRDRAPLSEDVDALVASWDGVMIPMREWGSIPWREAGVATISVYGQGVEGIEKKDTRYLARMPESRMRTLVTQIELHVDDAQKARDFREAEHLSAAPKAIFGDTLNARKWIE